MSLVRIVYLIFVAIGQRLVEVCYNAPFINLKEAISFPFTLTTTRKSTLIDDCNLIFLLL